MFIKDCKEKCTFTSAGSFVLNGTTIPYKTICEDNVFCTENDTSIASIFSYSYFRSDVADNSTRPVLFAYNGGPGCASLWVHLGLFGPKRLKLDDELHLPTVPPFALEDNPHCLLDICDLVLVDPVATGFGQLLDESKKELFFSTDADTHSLALFIENWLIRYRRRNSPVLLAGESYGTGRSALLVGELLGARKQNTETMGVSVSGIMLLGSTFFADVPVERAMLDLYSMAATYHYHRPEGLPDRDTFMQQAEHWCDTEYLVALHKGDALCATEKQKIAQQLSYYTGISEKYIIAHNLRIDMRKFMHLVLEERNEVVGFYDSRYTWPENKQLEETNRIIDDPAMGQYTPAFVSAFGLMCQELNIDFDRQLKPLSFTVGMAWDRSFETSPAMSLANSMRRNPKLSVFFASGDFDLCTTTGMSKYLAHHSNLVVDRVLRRSYPSGHMAYLGEESANLLGADMREFFTKAIKA